MTGELKEWSKSVPIGDTHHFDFHLSRNCADTNLQLLVQLIEEVDRVYHTLKNLNTIEKRKGVIKNAQGFVRTRPKVGNN